MPGKSTTSCSTAYETVTRESCSTVLTYAFSKTTISDCSHNITFSSQTTYALATTTLPVTGGGPQARDAASVMPVSTTITYVQSTVSYYAAPWQSLAADTPTGITVLSCVTDYSGVQTCVSIEEVWVVHTEYIPLTTTSTLCLSTSFSSVCVFPFYGLSYLLTFSGRCSPPRSNSKPRSFRRKLYPFHPRRVCNHVSKCDNINHHRNKQPSRYECYHSRKFQDQSSADPRDRVNTYNNGSWRRNHCHEDFKPGWRSFRAVSRFPIVA